MNHRDLLLFTTCCISGHFSLGQATADADHFEPQGFIAEAPVLKVIQLSTGVEMQYAEQGAVSGFPVIFLHGYTDSWHSYEQVFTHLPTGVKAYALSLRGHGNSEKPAGGYTPEGFAGDVEAFMQQLHIPSAIIVGHSMGTLVAQRLALDHPQRVKAMVLIGGFASMKTNPAVQEFGKVIAGLNDPIDSAFVYEFQKSTLARELDWSSMHTFVTESRKLPARVWKAAMDGMLPADFRLQLPRLKMPALIVWGSEDVLAPRREQEFLRKGIKNSQLKVYQGAGHAAHWEEPERFAYDLLNFMLQVEEN